MAHPRMRLSASSSRVKAPHQDGFFRVATLRGVPTALCQNEHANADLTTRSALTESTPLECDIDLPRNNCGRATIPMLNQFESVWAGVWHTTITT